MRLVAYLAVRQRLPTRIGDLGFAEVERLQRPASVIRFFSSVSPASQPRVGDLGAVEVELRATASRLVIPTVSLVRCTSPASVILVLVEV